MPDRKFLSPLVGRGRETFWVLCLRVWAAPEAKEEDRDMDDDDEAATSPGRGGASAPRARPVPPFVLSISLLAFNELDRLNAEESSKPKLADSVAPPDLESEDKGACKVDANRTPCFADLFACA